MKSSRGWPGAPVRRNPAAPRWPGATTQKLKERLSGSAPCSACGHLTVVEEVFPDGTRRVICPDCHHKGDA